MCGDCGCGMDCCDSFEDMDCEDCLELDCSECGEFEADCQETDDLEDEE